MHVIRWQIGQGSIFLTTDSAAKHVNGAVLPPNPFLLKWLLVFPKQS